MRRPGRRSSGPPADTSATRDLREQRRRTRDLHSLEAISEQEWSRVIDVYQRGTWLGLRALAPVDAIWPAAARSST